MEDVYMGIDVGSISTKGVILTKENKILSSEYIWTEGNPIGAAPPEAPESLWEPSWELPL